VAPKASVLVLNYNGERFLDDCFSSLLAQQLDGEFEAVLVDNGSADGSVAHVRLHFPSVRVLELGANLGFSIANNRAIASSRAPYCVVLNNDTRVRPGWLQGLVEVADAHPDAGAVTSKILFMDPPATIQNAGSMLLTDGSGADRGFQEPDTGQFEATEEVFGACGASMLLRREMLDDVGGFDETFFAYYEDTDLSWRMRLRGWRIFYSPRSVVDHAHSATNIEWSPFFTFHVDRNRLFMILKNGPATMVTTSFARFAIMSLRNAVRAVLGRMIRPPAMLRRANLGAGRARIHIKVMLSFARYFPEMLWKRLRIRRRRRVADADIMRWLYSKELWDARSR
jgi:GT2 family glycosyltransferase